MQNSQLWFSSPEEFWHLREEVSNSLPNACRVELKVSYLCYLEYLYKKLFVRLRDYFIVTK